MKSGAGKRWKGWTFRISVGFGHRLETENGMWILHNMGPLRVCNVFFVVVNFPIVLQTSKKRLKVWLFSPHYVLINITDSWVTHASHLATLKMVPQPWSNSSACSDASSIIQANKMRICEVMCAQLVSDKVKKTACYESQVPPRTTALKLRSVLNSGRHNHDYENMPPWRCFTASLQVCKAHASYKFFKIIKCANNTATQKPCCVVFSM